MQIKHVLNTLTALLLSHRLVAQVKTTALNKSTLPASLRYSGRIINAVNYTDKTGQHLVITTETGEKTAKSGEESYRDAALFAYSYTVLKGSYHLDWKVQDFINECPVDINANYVPGTFSVTDLDNDHVAEVWLMYKTACHGDVSPSDMKIIMYEGGKKYAIRGTNKIEVGEKQYEGGAYTADVAFKTGPQVFAKYAATLWKKNLLSN